jgi:hypothetical protein
MQQKEDYKVLIKCKNCGKNFTYYGDNKIEYCKFECEVENKTIYKKFEVIKIEDTLKYLEPLQMMQLANILKTIECGRKEEGENINNKYYIVNQDEPYSNKVKELILSKV